jgi:hypothetical protein
MSTILVDNLTGKTSAGDITVTSEGGAATMQLQQGLAKHWGWFDTNTSNTVRNSFNNASITDNSTGNYTVAATNAFANIYSCVGCCTGSASDPNVSGHGRPRIMAGKIIADQIEHSTAGSLDTSYVVNGSAKAWVNFNGTSTIVVRDALNVSGLVDNTTGDYTVNFTSSMSNNDYSVSGSCRD